MARHAGYSFAFNPKTNEIIPVHDVDPSKPLPEKDLPKLFDPDAPLLNLLPPEDLDSLALKASEIRRLSTVTTLSTDEELKAATACLGETEIGALMLAVLHELRSERQASACALHRRSLEGDGARER